MCPTWPTPTGVRPVAGARRALSQLRRRGVAVGVVSNQSGVARGLISPDALGAGQRPGRGAARARSTPGRSARTASTTAARCRKPAPGMVEAAPPGSSASAPDQCVVIGDIGADVDAALAAGARAVLVPTPETRVAEIDRAGLLAAVAPTLGDAVRLSIGEPSMTVSASQRAGGKVLLARLDSMGDVLLTGGGGPSGGGGRDEVTMLVGRGQAKWRGCCRVWTPCSSSRRPGWSSIRLRCRAGGGGGAGAAASARERFDRALIFTSFHQSPLPLALLLRMAGVGWIGAISEDYPGLPAGSAPPRCRRRARGRAQSLAGVGGRLLPDADGAALAVRRPLPDPSTAPGLPCERASRTWCSIPVRRPVPGGRPPRPRGAGRRPGRSRIAGRGDRFGGGVDADRLRRRRSRPLGARPRRAAAICRRWRRSSTEPAAWWRPTPARPTWRRPSAPRWCRCSPRWSPPAAGGRTGSPVRVLGRPARHLPRDPGPHLPDTRASVPDSISPGRRAWPPWTRCSARPFTDWKGP